MLVDGTRLRQTPVRDFELPAGKHTIELVNEGKNRREKVQVTITIKVLRAPSSRRGSMAAATSTIHLRP